LQSPLDGMDFCTEPFAAPQAASSSFGALQEALSLPLAHVHVHGPLPCTALGLPSAQSALLGAEATP